MKKKFNPECAICGDMEERLLPLEAGHICEPCLERGRTGRDRATQAARAIRLGMTDEATAAMYRMHDETESAERHESMASVQANKADALLRVDEIPAIAHSEIVPKRAMRLKDTLTAPDAVALGKH